MAKVENQWYRLYMCVDIYHGIIDANAESGCSFGSPRAAYTRKSWQFLFEWVTIWPGPGLYINSNIFIEMEPTPK